MGDIDLKDVKAYESSLHSFFKKDHPDLLKKIKETGDLEKELEEELKEALDAFNANFKLLNGAA